MSNSLVSIITANYNGENFIGDTIESVLSQTYPNWELIIIDDASTDQSMEIIKSYLDKEQRINLLTNTTNRGAAITRNRGIESAKGKYIAFLDGDDIWLSEKLEKQISFMENSVNCFFSTSYYEWIDESGINLNRVIKTKEKLTYSDLLDKNRIGCLTAIYNQEELGKVYMPLLRKRQDYGLWLELLKRTTFCYTYPEVTALYRVRENSISSNKLEMLKWNWNANY